MGVTQKALAAGVPVCVVPFGRDQPEERKTRVEDALHATRAAVEEGVVPAGWSPTDAR